MTPFGTNDIYEPRINGRHVQFPGYHDQWIWMNTDFRKSWLSKDSSIGTTTLKRVEVVYS